MHTHAPGCVRTANAYDPKCPRCEEIRASVRAKARPRNPMEVERDHIDSLRRKYQVERQFNAAFAATLLIVALAALYLLTRLVGFVRAH
jgi:hypothetical protein